MASPRIPDAALARCPGAGRPPRPHTAAELARLLRMLHTAGAASIAIGHGRHPASAAAARVLAAAWAGGPGTVLATASWPATAASWLRPARRLAAGRPDAWVIADTPAGCAQLAMRLTGQPGWAPARTFGFASLASPDLITLTGTALTGMTGPTASGGIWRIGRGLLIRNDGAPSAAP
ncbi:MAG TPA: hypothetical protein VGM53_16280 [Streptosporangiaceae bacterium]